MFNMFAEGHIIKNGCEEKPLSSNEESVFKKIIEGEKQIKILDLIRKTNKNKEIVGDDMKKDQETVENCKDKFGYGSTKRGKILEVTLKNLMNENGWLGDNCKATRTIDFDDYANHTDFVVEFFDDDNNVVSKMAVDVTVSDKDECYDKKFLKIKNELDKKHGTRIKYFPIEGGTKYKSINDIPSVVIAMSSKQVDELCKLLCEIDKKEESEDVLNNNLIQLTLLDDMIDMLNHQADYLKEEEETNRPSDIYKNIKQLLSLLEEIRENKESSLVSDDNPLGALGIVKICDKFKRSLG